MATCGNCSFYFKIPENADDYEPGKGDCINQVEDEKGKYWLSKPVFDHMDTCPNYKKR